MKVEQAKQIVSRAIEQLSRALERGHSETLEKLPRGDWPGGGGGGENVMLIASQKPTAKHVTGFHTWHKLGRFVKKGEKGILILAPIVRAKNQSIGQTETDESSTPAGFRAAYVFDISQTDGQELPDIGNVNGDPREYRERLGKFVTDQGILLEYSAGHRSCSRQIFRRRQDHFVARTGSRRRLLNPLVHEARALMWR